MPRAMPCRLANWPSIHQFAEHGQLITTTLKLATTKPQAHSTYNYEHSLLHRPLTNLFTPGIQRYGFLELATFILAVVCFILRRS
jgi:hypothetical protein